MVTNHTTTVPALAAFSGITTHLFLYRHGEWDVNAPKLVIIYIVLLLVAVTLDSAANNTGVELAQRPFATKTVGYHLLGVYGSMTFYRIFLHRLSRFPGPFLARLSNFYVTALSARKLHLYEETEKLHRKYGDYVRLGKYTLNSHLLVRG
jgi:bisphosphoglycerate-dependent phosphoglycerate mutase